MRPRPLAATAAAALVVGAVAGPALASAGTVASATSAVGSATSTVTLLSLLAASHDVEVGGLTLSTDALTTNPTSSVTVTPVRADGTSYGAQTVTPASSPSSVGAFPTPTALGGLFTVHSPVVSISASKGSAHAGTSSLGSLSLLGLPVGIDGGVDAGSSVASAAGALGSKTLTVKNVKLPDIASLLAADGLDLSKLPAASLTSLANQLGLVNNAISTAESALTAATVPLQSQIDAALGQVASATTAANTALAALTTKNAGLNAANAALATATANSTAADAAVTAANSAASAATTALNAKLGAIPGATLIALPGANTIAGYALLTPAQKAIVDTAVPGTSAADNIYMAAAAAQASAVAQQATAAATMASATATQTAAQAAATVAQTASDAAATALATAKSGLAAIVAQLAPQATAVVNAVLAQLAATPLVSLDSLVVQTTAQATSAAAGGQLAKVVGGQVSGLKVLGTDVLAKALGASSVDAVALTGSTLDKVSAEIGSLTGVLSSVLSTVPGLPALKVPAPVIDLLTKSTSVGVAGGFGTAKATVQALKITLPSLSIPAAVALPGGLALPAVSGLPTIPVAPTTAVTDLVSKAMTIGVGSVSEQAKFKPSVVGAPGTPGTTGTPTLPKTGLGAGVGLLAVTLVGGGLLIRRRVVASS